MDIQSIKRACELMHKTGADDTQYILIRLCDLEEMVKAWERDKILQGWIKSIVDLLEEVGIGNDEDQEEKGSRGESFVESGTHGYSEEPDDREMDHGKLFEEGSTPEPS